MFRLVVMSESPQMANFGSGQVFLWSEDGPFCVSHWMPSPSKRVGISSHVQIAQVVGAPTEWGMRRQGVEVKKITKVSVTWLSDMIVDDIFQNASEWQTGWHMSWHSRSRVIILTADEAALKLAQCILQARHSPVMEAQLRLLKEDPGNESLERQELKERCDELGRVWKFPR